MPITSLGLWAKTWIMAVCLALLGGPVLALDTIRFRVDNDSGSLRDALREASLIVAAKRDGRENGEDVLAAALADYPVLVETLYANGYYGGVVSITLDGREAVDISILNVPAEVKEAIITIGTGPRFRFGLVEILPLRPETVLPADVARGEPARSPALRSAVTEAVDAWRAAGYAKARVASQDVVADHATARLDARVRIDPGPLVHFGELLIAQPSAVRDARLRRLAGFPTGERYSPEAMDTVARRLRRTGAFSSVSLIPSDTVGPDGSMDVTLNVSDEKPRRFGVGAQISSLAGLELSGFWLHRNYLGGAESFRIDASISNIGSDESGTDYKLGARMEIPANWGPDTALYFTAGIEHLDEPDYVSDELNLGTGASRIFSPELEASIGIELTFARTDDDLGSREFNIVSLPIRATWDRRDDRLDPTAGTYLGADVMPFLAMDGSASGARVFFDGRAYHGFGADNRVVVAGRVQIGSVLEAGVTDVHPDFLFYSGGGNTVRGQPYRSLSVELDDGSEIGGRSFIGLSGEVRVAVWRQVGLVAFYDAGYIGPEPLYDGSGEWHQGAGLGLRYKTTVGPLRLDLAAPVGGGDGGSGVEIYLGIGQAF